MLYLDNNLSESMPYVKSILVCNSNEVIYILT